MRNKIKKSCMIFQPYREKMRIMTLNTKGVSDDASERYPYLIESILLYLPDILGMQEVRKRIYPNVIDKISNYYSVTCRAHKSGVVNYTPILYRKDKFNVVEAGVEWLNARYTGTNTKSVSWAVLKCSYQDNLKIGVVNLHSAVLSNKYIGYENTTQEERHTICDTWRVDNVHQMLRIKEDIIKIHGDMPFIFMGDYNCGSDSNAYKAVINAGFNEAETTASTALFNGKETLHEIGEAPTDGISIDHIFGTEDIIFDFYSMGDTPHDLLASDHCPVFTDILIANIKSH